MDMTTEELINELLLASEIYYQAENEVLGEGETLLEDEEYDDKIMFLRELAENDKVVREDSRVIALLEGSVAGGSAPSKEDEIVHHTVPMLSLDKANTEDEVKSFITKSVKNGAKGHKIQAKIDGFATSIKYEDGKMASMATRGDGAVGQDISYLINNPELSILGAPLVLDTIKSCELRGEFFATNSQFEKINKTRLKRGEKLFKNSRNGIVGVLTKAKGGLGYSVEVTFVTYSLLINDKYIDLDLLDKEESNIVTVDSLTRNELNRIGNTMELRTEDSQGELMSLIHEFGLARPDFDTPTDGAVIKPINEAEMFNRMGSTSHHPNAFIAFKYPSEKAQGEVLDIILSVGKTGRITPIAMLTPTNLSGVIVSRATCHNFSWLYEKDIRVGSKVMITRANDVIPAISTVINKGDGGLLPIPEVCPECGDKLVSDGKLVPKTLKCNNDDCPSRLFFQMRTVTSRQGLDIDGLNNVGLLALCETGKLTSVASLFSLTSDDLKDLVMGESSKGNPRKFGENRANKIISLIEKAKTSTPAYKLLNTLGYNGLGPSSTKLLLKELGSIEAVVNATSKTLSSIDGFGDIKAEIILSHKERAKTILKELIDLGVVLDNGLSVAPSTSLGSFAISGKVPVGFDNRGQFIDYMEKKGWKFDSSPKKTTTVVFGDSEDTSSKIVKAKKLGLRIVSPEDYDSI